MFDLRPEDKKWVEETWARFEEKLSAVTDKTGDKIPYTTIDGTYDDQREKRIHWWTNGFWPGLMLILYDATKNEKYLNTARQNMKDLDRALHNQKTLDHDVGFLWNISSGFDYRMTGDEEQKNRMMLAADHLMSRYNIVAKYIRAWNYIGHKGKAIIDCMMNLPLLYRATEITEDDRFKMVAMSHADTTLAYHLRADGSCNHINEYDPVNGGFLSNNTGQGFKGYQMSSWSRGQAWALYGFALSYAHTQKQDYLDAAKRSAHYFIANVVNTGWVPLSDFRAPKEPVIYDTTAGACAACGMIEIAKHVNEYEKEMYLNAAINILKAMTEKHCCFDSTSDAVLLDGTEAYEKVEGRHISIIYGDFFYAEALHKLRGFDSAIW